MQVTKAIIDAAVVEHRKHINFQLAWEGDFEAMRAALEAALAKQRSLAITVWKNGTHKLWSAYDAMLAENEEDWLTTIPFDAEALEVPDDKTALAEKEGTADEVERASPNYDREALTIAATSCRERAECFGDRPGLKRAHERAAEAIDALAAMNAAPQPSLNEELVEALRELVEFTDDRPECHDGHDGDDARDSEDKCSLCILLRKARAALSRAAAVKNGWQPIESAPRVPYAPIDLWVVPGKRLDGLERSKPYRAANAYAGGNVHWCDSKGNYLEGRQYYEDGDRCFDIHDRGPDASIVTHWRPLPPPPSQKDQT